MVLAAKPARLAFVAISIVFLLAFSPRVFAFSNGQAASLVIGQANLTSLTPGSNAAGLVGPFALAFDSSHNLWVADAYGNRVLEYNPPFSNHEAASVVIGQSSFTGISPGTTASTLSTPNGIAFDSAGNLWVSDSSNNRVLEFKVPLSTGEAASLVIGQPGFASSGFDTTNATSLNSPNGLTFDSHGNLWVADLLNGRVLEYKAPLATREAASLVIGEGDLNTSDDVVSPAGLNAPNSVTLDSSGNLWVADGHRVLEYTTPLSTNESATIVIGQNNFYNSSTITSTTGMDNPNGLAFDSAGNLWVSDKLDNRVLEYQTPLTTFEAATVVIGQSNFTSSATTPETQPKANSLDQPTGLAFDSSGNLWVADFGDGRVLQYGSGGAAVTATTSSSITHTTPEFPAQVVPLVFVAVLATIMIFARRSRRVR